MRSHMTTNSEKRVQTKKPSARRERKKGFVGKKTILSVFLLLSLLVVTLGAVGYVIFFRTLPA